MKDNVYMLNAEEARVALAAFNRLERLGREEMEQDARHAGEHPVPERVLKKYRAILKRGRWKAYWKSAKGRMVRVAIAVLVIGSLIVPYFTVDAYRVNVQNFFYSISDGITEFISRHQGGNPSSNGAYLPAYMPKGFTRITSEPRGDEYYMKYVKNDDWVVFTQSISEYGKAGVNIDIDNAIMVSINGLSAAMSETPYGGFEIIWSDETTIFMIETTLNSDECIKIAENIK